MSEIFALGIKNREDIAPHDFCAYKDGAFCASGEGGRADWKHWLKLVSKIFADRVGFWQVIANNSKIWWFLHKKANGKSLYFMFCVGGMVYA